MPHSYVSFGMYPFEPLRPAWEMLWSAVRERVPSFPAIVRWDVEPRRTWTDGDCALSQACGWPVATRLRGVVDVVGAFSLDIPDADEHRYRSVIVSKSAELLGTRDLSATTAAATSDDSLSGWISLCAASGVSVHAWPGGLTWTGSHLNSVATLVRGEADVTSIDALSWAHISHLHSDLTEGLHVIGHGPWVPSLPVIVPSGTTTAARTELRHAFVAAIGDESIADARSVLLLDGFVSLENEAYECVVSLARAR